ncbi:MAG: tetratricopeptide repeat protein, partial [Bacteroidetes bacterium]|nr:tetratricopeptide repeat protein [Bacteroidota bacterium]
VLFVMPGILILSGIGWDMLMAAKARLLNGIALVLLLGGMGWTAKWIVQNHPYEYMYYNELVGGVKGAFGNYELDYWCQTPKEAMQWLLDEEGLKDKKATVVSNNEVYSIIYYADKNQTNGKELRSIERQVADIDDDIDRLGHYKKEGLINEAEYNLEVEALKKEADPLRQKIRDMKKVNVLWARESQWNYDYWDYAIWTNRTLSPTLIKKGYFPPKGTIHTIDVDGVPIAAIVKRENQYMADAHACKKRNQLDSAEMYLKMYLEYDSLEEEAYRTLAEIQVMKSNWSEAIRYADKSLNLVPESFYSHNFKGIAYLRLGQLTEAEQSFKEVIKFKPNFSAGHDGLGDVAYSQRDFNNAIKHYQTALSFAGNNYFIYYKMGACYLEMNDLNNAANHFNASIQTNGNFAASYKGMYDVLIKAGQADRAQEYLIKYQQLGGR